MAEHDPRTSNTVDLMQALRAIVGAAHVLDDAASLRRYASSTAGADAGTRPLAVVRPGGRAEVVAIMAAASSHRVAVYPVSTGKNWGYGDACAVGAGQLILELARMDRIVTVDAELAYAVIEPGVTQGQLAAYLREHRIGLWCDCTGAGPDTSLIGNILERGFGHSPYGNRFHHISGMRVVLASGETLCTGFGHYPQSQVSHLFSAGVGPALDGLFTQSNLGVVVELGIWLMPAAACVSQFIATVPRQQDLGPLIEALRPLRQDGTLRSVVHIGNDLRVVSGACTFPFAQDGDGASPSSRLSPDLRDDLLARSGAQAWTVSGCLYGSAAQIRAGRAAVRQALRGAGARTAFFDQRSLDAGARAGRLLAWCGLGKALLARVALGRALLAMAQGVPNGRFLAGAYWRRRGGLPAGFPQRADPAQDGCGLLWVSPILPMQGAHALALQKLVAPLFAHHGFDLFMTISLINERALCAVLTVAFDRDNAGEAARARACHRAVFDAVMAAGYLPYRVGIESMAALDAGGDVFWQVSARIKAALDPQGLIAPGRYEPAVARRLRQGRAA
ncbi:FAD-binding oxidoreductase [Massilia sp. DWR3-1-1]|uniref:FAD-binding oxidoreductase n=1 Tax=Massilia sp. DWR3-1-1 TaxID=2804559 RepID=UPI003CE7C2D0